MALNASFTSETISLASKQHNRRSNWRWISVAFSNELISYCWKGARTQLSTHVLRSTDGSSMSGECIEFQPTGASIRFETSADECSIEWNIGNENHRWQHERFARSNRPGYDTTGCKFHFVLTIGNKMTNETPMASYARGIHRTGQSTRAAQCNISPTISLVCAAILHWLPQTNWLNWLRTWLSIAHHMLGGRLHPTAVVFTLFSIQVSFLISNKISWI